MSVWPRVPGRLQRTRNWRLALANARMPDRVRHSVPWVEQCARKMKDQVTEQMLRLIFTDRETRDFVALRRKLEAARADIGWIGVGSGPQKLDSHRAGKSESWEVSAVA